MNRPIVIGLILFVIVLGGVLLLVRQRPAPPPENTGSQTASSPASPPESAIQTQRKINVKLYFTNQNSTRLVAEERSIPYHESLAEQAREVLKELIAGPQSGLQSTIPGETQILDLFLTKDGIAFVDFSGELSAKLPGGSLSEMCAVYSIVNTLTLNLPQIKSVQILVDDQALVSLNGHLDLSKPLAQDLSLVNAAESATTE